MQYQSLPLELINIAHTRIRKDFGDIQSLADSIQELGLLSPIIINKDHTLLAGERRLEACKLLGWTEVDVIIKDTDDAENELMIEFSENKCRKEFTREEEIDVGLQLERIEKSKAEERMLSGKADPQENFPQGGGKRNLQVRDIIGKKLGISGKQYEREKFIVENKDLLSPGEYSDWNNREISTNKIYNELKILLGNNSSSVPPQPKEPIIQIKEVPPADYEAVKAELKQLKNSQPEISVTNETQLNEIKEQQKAAEKERDEYKRKYDELLSHQKSYEDEIIRLKNQSNSSIINQADAVYDFYEAVNNFVSSTLSPLLYDDLIDENQHGDCAGYIIRACDKLIDVSQNILKRFKTEKVIDEVINY